MKKYTFLKLPILLLLLLLCNTVLKAQLKATNYLLIDQAKHKIQTDNGASGTKGFVIYDTSFSFSKNLVFSYADTPIASRGCCSYEEVKRIPKEWNIIKVDDIVSFLEKETHINPFKHKIFFIQRDKGTKIYKIYQADLSKTWLMD